MIKKLPREFYTRDDVVLVARELIGKIIVTRFDNTYTTARIIETEAYEGITDRASHAFGGRRTKRTEPMYALGGSAYVYLCYGIHHLFNIVTNRKEIPHAVLIRSMEPLEGIPMMLKRTGKKHADQTLGKGPGNVGKALGINIKHTGMDLVGEEIYLIDDGLTDFQIEVSKRIGIDYAGEAADWLYRFTMKSPSVKKKVQT